MTAYVYSATIGGMPANNPDRFDSMDQAQAFLLRKQLHVGPPCSDTNERYWRVFDAYSDMTGILDERSYVEVEVLR